MKNTKIMSVLLTGLLLFSCAKSNLNPIQSNLTKVRTSSISMLSAEDSDRLSQINTSIDFATGTKNSINNYNVKFYVDGPNAFPALERMILDAKESIFIEVFIFENDYTGRKFADALVAKVKEGVKVHFLYEYIANTDVKLINYMAKNGVVVETYNKGALNISNIVNATHRKLYIFDGKSAMTGGMNVGDEYSLGEWHDLLMSFEGDAVKDMMKEYYYDWKKAGGEIIPYMEELYKRTLERKIEEKTFPLRITVTSPTEADKKEDIKRMMMAAMSSAKTDIKVAMPYFSEDEFIKHLKVAAQRGVKVTAIIPYKSDKAAYDKLNTSSSNDLLSAGVDVYRGDFDTKAFNHSKAMTVDNVWTTIGSCNADSLSFSKNQELNVAISDPDFTKAFNEQFFAHHLKNAKKAEHVNIPWYQKPLYSFLEGIDGIL